MSLPPLASDPSVPKEAVTVRVPVSRLTELGSRAERLGWTVPALVEKILFGDFPARQRFPILSLEASPEAVEVIESAGYALAHALDWHSGGWVSREGAPFPGSTFVSRFAFVAEGEPRLVEIVTSFEVGVAPYVTSVGLVPLPEGAP